MTVDCGHLDLAAKHGSGEVEHEVIDQIVAIAHELRMTLFLDNHKQIARNATAGGLVAFASHAQGHAFGHACRDVDGNNIFFSDKSLSATVRAAFLDDFAATAASLTGALRLHVAEQCALHSHFDAATVAVGACIEGCAVFSTCAMTVLARDESWQFQFLFHAMSCIVQVYFHTDAQVAASFHPVATGGTT